MELRLILINLLVKLGLAAALAAALVRSVEFKALLYREQRALRDRIYLVFWLVISEWIGKALAAGVWKFGATPSPIVGDLSLETTILLGALAGRFAGAQTRNPRLERHFGSPGEMCFQWCCERVPHTPGRRSCAALLRTDFKMSA